MKLKREDGEGKIDFAVRVVETHGDWISADDAFKLIDRRTYRELTVQKLRAQLSIAEKTNRLSKRRTVLKNGKKPTQFAPIKVEQDAVKEMLNPVAEPAEAIEATVEKVQRSSRATVDDVPYGALLSFTGKSRDDIMSVIEDLLYDTPMGELKENYPGLYEAVKRLV